MRKNDGLGELRFSYIGTSLFNFRDEFIGLTHEMKGRGTSYQSYKHICPIQKGSVLEENIAVKSAHKFGILAFGDKSRPGAQFGISQLLVVRIDIVHGVVIGPP